MKTRLLHLWDNLSSRFWLVPATIVVLAGVTLNQASSQFGPRLFRKTSCAIWETRSCWAIAAIVTAKRFVVATNNDSNVYFPFAPTGRAGTDRALRSNASSPKPSSMLNPKAADGGSGAATELMIAGVPGGVPATDTETLSMKLALSAPGTGSIPAKPIVCMLLPIAPKQHRGLE
jgi:hypothetical protein